MGLKVDSLLKDVASIKDDTNDELNVLKPEIIKYLGRNVIKEKIINSTIAILTVLVFLSLTLGKFIQ